MLGAYEKKLWKGALMKSSAANLVMPLCLVAVGIAIGAAGIYLGETDDAPGAALMGILLMIGMVALGVRKARRRRSTLVGNRKV